MAEKLSSVPEKTKIRLRAWRRYAGLLFAGIVFLFLLLVLYSSRERSLLDMAHRVASVKAVSQFQWMSNEDILFMPRGSWHMDRQAPLIERNIRTGTTRTIGSLESLGGGYGRFFNPLLSPDGKRLLWVEVAIDTSELMEASLDGKQRFGLMASRMQASAISWLQNSSYFIAFYWEDEYSASAPFVKKRRIAVIYNVKNGQVNFTQKLKLPDAFDSRNYPAIQMSPNGKIIAYPKLENTTVTPSVDVIETRLALTGTSSPKSIKTHVVLSGVPPRKFRVTLPHNAYVQAVALSPQGDKIAWWIVQRRSPSLADYIHMYFHTFPTPRPFYACLWTCRIDGSNMQEIGTLPGTTITDDNWLRELENFVWLPDGKQVTFVYKNAIWTLPVE